MSGLSRGMVSFVLLLYVRLLTDISSLRQSSGSPTGLLESGILFPLPASCAVPPRGPKRGLTLFTKAFIVISGPGQHRRRITSLAPQTKSSEGPPENRVRGRLPNLLRQLAASTLLSLDRLRRRFAGFGDMRLSFAASFSLGNALEVVSYAFIAEGYAARAARQMSKTRQEMHPQRSNPSGCFGRSTTIWKVRLLFYPYGCALSHQVRHFVIRSLTFTLRRAQPSAHAMDTRLCGGAKSRSCPFCSIQRVMAGPVAEDSAFRLCV